MGKIESTTPLLTNEEAVRFLRLDTDYPHDMAAAIRALHRLVRKRKLRPVQCGTTYKFAVAELERYIAAAIEEFSSKAVNKSSA